MAQAAAAFRAWNVRHVGLQADCLACDDREEVRATNRGASRGSGQRGESRNWAAGVEKMR